MTRKNLLKRIIAAAIVALDTFMVVFAFADLFLATVFRLLNAKRGGSMVLQEGGDA
jgi:hypothetical protein